MISCKYCGKEAKYTLKNGSPCCESSPNKCPEIKCKNSKGLKNSYVTGNKVPIFTSEHRDKSNLANVERAKFESFGENVSRLTTTAKKYILEFRNYTCEICGIKTWNGKPLTFEIDHIDGDTTNNRLTNLRCLCPNCHSQTSTWRGRNINNGKKLYSDDVIINTYLQSDNIHQTLLTLGMAAKGANYSTIKKILNNNNIKFK